MPHAFVHTDLSPQRILQSLERMTYRFEALTIKTQAGYRHTATNRVILPCLVVEPYRKQRFFIEVRKKDDGLLVRANALVLVVKTTGVRLALALAARQLAAQDPEATLDKANLAPFVDFLALPDAEKSGRLAGLRNDIRPYLREVLFRQQAAQATLALDSYKPPLNWESIYHNANPVEIEIGPGKGSFLLRESGAHPERNYLGIEWASRYLKILTRRIGQHAPGNLRLVPGDARQVFAEWLPAGSVAAVHIYFPDPWWKKKHQKFQLFSPDFVDDVQRSLRPDGRVMLATDVAELFDEAARILGSSDSLELTHKKTYHPGDDPPPGRSNFEIKKWAAASPIHEAVWQKQ